METRHDYIVNLLQDNMEDLYNSDSHNSSFDNTTS